LDAVGEETGYFSSATTASVGGSLPAHPPSMILLLVSFLTTAKTPTRAAQTHSAQWQSHDC